MYNKAPLLVKAVALAGAPFTIVLPLTVTSGVIYGSATSITIPAGSIESLPLTVGRIVGTTADVTVDISTLPSRPANHNGYTLVKSVDLPLTLSELAASTQTPLSERTQQISNEIMRVQGLNSVNDITAIHISGIGVLNLTGRGITSLKSGDFDGFTELTHLRLNRNQLRELPEDIFRGLSKLTYLDLSFNELRELPDGLFQGLSSLRVLLLYLNTVEPLPLTVSLEKIADGQFKAVVPTGAPFSMELPLTITNGSISGGATSVTIPAGGVESEPLTVTRIQGTTAAVTVDIGPLPGLPQAHEGYALVKSAELPLELFPALAIVDYPLKDRTQQVQNAIVNATFGVTSAERVTNAHLSNLTSLVMVSYGVTSLKPGDFDGLTGLTTLTIAWNRLASLPPGIFDKLTSLTTLNLQNNDLATLPSGIFAELSNLTSLNLSNNALDSLPDGIFTGLTSLESLSLSGNDVDPFIFSVTLEKVADGQFKVVVPSAACFDMVLPLNILNGNLSSNSTTVTIPRGRVESAVLTVAQTAGTSAAVLVDIGTLPALPQTHTGYSMEKSVDLPITVIEGTPTVTTPTDPVAQVTTVNIPDSGLRAAIESVLNKTSNAAITAAEMATLTNLNAQDSAISDLTGLETATNLTILHLWGNNITDISPVANLTKLRTLSLHENTISDITSVQGLANLTTLRIGKNTISDISPVSRLTKLEWLDAPYNNISDISHIANLTTLTSLFLDDNNISDISHLSGLSNLIELIITNNNIANLSPLVSNTGFDTDDEIYVRGNPLSYPSIYTHIPALQAKDVYIDFDSRVATAPIKISGDMQTGNIGTALAQPLVVEVKDADSVVFAGVPVTFAVTAGGGRLSTTNTTTDAKGRAQSTLTLGNTAGTNTVSVSVTGVTQTITFTATATAPVVVSITPVADRTPIVAEAILNVVKLDYPNVSSYSDITATHLSAPDALYLNNRNITALKSGDFDGFTSVSELRLDNNQLTSLPSDIFTGMSSLSNLNLFNNQLSSLPDDIFEGLTTLTTIRLGHNTVDPIPLSVTLEKVTEGQFKAVAPTGALFAIVLPITVTNGSITGGTTSLTIPKGSVESETLTVTRTAGTTAVVTVDIGTLPSLPRNHYGYDPCQI